MEGGRGRGKGRETEGGEREFGPNFSFYDSKINFPKRRNLAGPHGSDRLK